MLKPNDRIQSAKTEVTGTSKIIFTGRAVLPAGAQRAPSLGGSLTLILDDGDSCYCNVSPNGLDAVVGSYDNQIVLTADNPSFTFEAFLPVELRAISAGTSQLYWIVGYRSY